MKSSSIQSVDRRDLGGTAISTGNSTSHEASTGVWPRSSRAEPNATIAVKPSLAFRFGLYVLHAWRTLDIINHLMSFPEKIRSESLWESPKTITPPAFREIILPSPILKSSLRPGDCDNHKDARTFFMSPWLQDLLGIPTPKETQTEYLEQRKLKGDWRAPTD